uniref:Innate immunity activator a n=1 Tax=Scleropages formosus TaxID=113540 RepID=A0A8C9SZF9_SCLFO
MELSGDQQRSGCQRDVQDCGPDSPASPMKELTGHTRVVRLKHKALEDRLERCLQELKQLCIREAELTGKIPREYPLQPGETPPLVRQRVGAAFVLKEENLTSLETSLALQQQILEAARNLCLEEHPSRSVRRSRLQQCKREEVKLKKLQQTLSQHTPLGGEHPLLDVLQHYLVRNQLFLMPLDPLPSAGSLQPPLQSMKPSPPQTLELPRQVQRTSMGYEHSPIQNSPWSESSLDQPYQKSRKPHSASSSRSTPVDPCLGDTPPVAPPTLGMALEDGQPHSAPCTPELHQRRTHSQLPKYEGSMVTDDNMGCARLPRRRASDFSGSSPLYPSSSEDSGSEHSLPSYSGSPCREGPVVMPKPPPPPYRYHLLARRNSPYTDAARVIGHHSDGHHHYHSGKRVHPADLNMGALPLHVRLAHAPSLRECSPHYGGALPQVQVHKELRSWKQHSQTRESRRPHSLDRLGPGREHRHQPMCVQVRHTQDREIVSQV